MCSRSAGEFTPHQIEALYFWVSLVALSLLLTLCTLKKKRFRPQMNKCVFICGYGGVWFVCAGGESVPLAQSVCACRHRWCELGVCYVFRFGDFSTAEGGEKEL